ncbi:MAG: universal stress protein [Anaerolineae bacterium]|nr:universal stress protein [Anaerolineae bacterium]
MRILIATGGSPHSDTALRLATYILQTQNITDRPTVMTVIKREAQRVRAERLLDQALEILRLDAPKVKTIVRVGHRVEQIVHEADRGNYDLLIIGERPVHRLLTRILGSTARRVMEQAPCPVIIAKDEIGPIKRILVCDSGAESPSLLIPFKAKLAGLSQGPVELTILHVMSQMTAGPQVRGKQLRAGVEELIREGAPEGYLLAQDIETLESPGIYPQPKVRHGLVVDEIVAEARSGDYDLVVIGANRREGWQHFLLDNLAQQIVTKVRRPILVMK